MYKIVPKKISLPMSPSHVIYGRQVKSLLYKTYLQRKRGFGCTLCELLAPLLLAILLLVLPKWAGLEFDVYVLSLFFHGNGLFLEKPSSIRNHFRIQLTPTIQPGNTSWIPSPRPMNHGVCFDKCGQLALATLVGARHWRLLVIPRPHLSLRRLWNPNTLP